jgi:uncharacterized membrane protein
MGLSAAPFARLVDSVQTSQHLITGDRTKAKAHAPIGLWFVTVLAAAVVVGWLASAQAPAALVWPVMSIAMVVAGLALAGALYLAGSRMTNGSTAAWEIAAALVLVGFAAALLADSDQTLALIERMETQGLAALSK